MQIDAILDKTSQEDARLMLWAIFPSLESYNKSYKDFEKQSPELQKKFIEYAFKKKLIQKEEDSDFKGLIEKSSSFYQNIKPSIEYTFETLINEIAAKGFSVVALVMEMRAIAKYFKFDDININQTFFTRLKQDFNPNTEKKKTYLLLLSLWLRIRLPDIPLNFQLLCNSPRNISKKLETIENCGILIAFALKGKDISPDTVKTLKFELLETIKYLNLNKVINEDDITLTTTRLVLRLPCISANSSALDHEDPRLYINEIQDAFSLSHCMLVQWDLSEYGSNAELIIAIETGRFSKIEETIDKFLTVSLPSDYSIRLSKLTYSVARSADIKIIYRKIDEHPDIWVVKYFWSLAYFETPPVILSLLPHNYDQYEKFKKVLYFADIADIDKNTKRIMALLNRYPIRNITIIEIAKLLILKRMYHEAISILANVISFDQNHIVARTLRMFAMACLAIGEPNYDIANLFFERSISEGKYIERYCELHEEFYTELGLVYWGKAQELVKRLRRNIINQAYETVKENIFTTLRQASEYFKKGFTFSASGADNRSFFWYTHVNAFIFLLEADEALLKSGELPLEDEKGVYELSGFNYFSSLGWIVKIPSSSAKMKKIQIDKEFLSKRMLAEIDTYLKSISSKSYLPNATYAAAGVLWDFIRKDMKIIEKVLLYLEKALQQVREAKRMTNPVGIYSCGASCCISIISPEEFIECIEYAIAEVKRVKKEKNFSSPMKLMLLNIERDINRDPITG